MISQYEICVYARPHLYPLPQERTSRCTISGWQRRRHPSSDGFAMIRWERFSFSRGRIALLGFAQRQICASRVHIPLNHHKRKPIPTTIKTLGDYIQAKRYEKGLHLHQVAGKMGIATSLVSAWENGTQRPDEKQWQTLSDLLSFDSGVDFSKPHGGSLLGFTQ